MKKQLLTFATIACFSLTLAPLAMAKGNEQDNPMRMFSKLNLSEQQRTDIKAIFKTSRQDNSVFAGEKAAFKNQMDDLMAMPSWDEATARSIISLQIEQGKMSALNRAKARHQAYNLLSDEQKSKLDEKSMQKDKREDKGKKRPNNKDKMNPKRMQKLLQLSDQQVAQIQAIDDSTKTQMMTYKTSSKAHRSTLQMIVQAPQFDEAAWLTLHDSAVNDMVNKRLVQTKAKYDKKALLTDEQQQKMQEIRNKMKEKRDDSGSIG